MSADLVVRRGLTKTDLKGWKFEITAGEPKAKSSGHYQDQVEGFLGRIPLMGSPDPYVPINRLIGISAEDEEGGMIKVSLTFESPGAGGEPGRPESAGSIVRYSAEISNGEEHILTHSRYGDNISESELKALLAISNGTLTDESGAAYSDSVTSELGQEALAKISKGTVARKSGGLIWVEKKTVTTLSGSSSLNYANINKTESPPGPVGGAAANWLYLGATATETAEGGAYDIEKRWEYSPDGWDADLYS